MSEKTKSFNQLRDYLVSKGLGKSAEHVTDTVDTGAVDHPDRAEEDVELGEIGPAAITKDLTLDTESEETPPAKVPDSGVVQGGDVKLPPESPNHPTNQKLKEQPKAADLKQAGADLEAAIRTLQEALPKKADDETSDDTSDDEDSEDDDDSEDEAAEETSEDSAAGYDAAKKVANLMLDKDRKEKQAAIDSFLEAQIVRGIEDGHKYADFLDGFIDQTVPAMAALEGGAGTEGIDPAVGGLEEGLGAEEETVATLEELGAMINALASGKEPQSDAERELLQILVEAGLITPNETGAEDAEVIDSDLGANTVTPEVETVDPIVDETKLASLLDKIKSMSSKELQVELAKGEKK